MFERWVPWWCGRWRNNDSKKHVINSADPATRTHASIATTKGSTFHTSSQKSAWIIDSGATNHMTFDPSQLISRKSSTLLAVSNANGKTIGCGTRRGKLYYLDWAPDNEVKVGQVFRTSGTRSEEERDKIWLWHKRLGHASFGYLKKLFPSLFSSPDVSSFQCDTCELAKSHRIPFPLSSNKSLVPFSLVHSDVWRLAQIAHEENRESTTAPILDFFPQDVTLHQTDRSPVESNRSPPLVLQLQRTYFKTTGRQQTTTGRQRKLISCLHAVKIRRGN
ncbi:hypothetical protein L3X38_026342 [Prunus dulcis]|uniref:GAG-pre-integrase domain-containing protein n=1 Tax=Prunus dulcis TaxID=3755 RepID=A0AAD4YZ81_PRUDU|nr:hypothetical protein L3X38_026342 [Prunus dulcis]